MTPDEEAYIHFQECLTSLNTAWAILVKLEDARIDATLWTASFHMALIEYAKPFKQSRGVHKRSHTMPLPQGDPGFEDLHERLIGLRDQVLAHADLAGKDAKVYIGAVNGQPIPLIISNTAQQLPTLTTVRRHIETLLDLLYAQIPAREHSLIKPS